MEQDALEPIKEEEPILSPEDARKWIDDLLVEQQAE